MEKGEDKSSGEELRKTNFVYFRIYLQHFFAEEIAFEAASTAPIGLLDKYLYDLSASRRMQWLHNFESDEVVRVVSGF